MWILSLSECFWKHCRWSTGPATGSSLRTHGDKKTAIIILFIMMAVTYSILSYTFHLFRRINYYFIPWRLFMYFNDLLLIFFAHSFKSTIHVSLHILIIYLNIWYYVQYVYSFYFYYPVLFSPFILIIIWISSTGLFIYYYKGLLYGNF